jgi:type I restriction enzyme S subunit
MTLETFFEKFDLFADAPDAVAKMRELVLHLAVTGKLTPQDPNEMSGGVLLTQINAERLAAVQARLIDPMKPPPPVGEAELLFDLRQGWASARLIELVMEIQTGPFGSSLHKSDYQIGGTPVINPASLKDGKIVPVNDMAIGPATLKRLEVFRLNRGDIVMARRGEMGRCAIVTKHEDGWLCGTGSLVLRMPRSLDARYLAMLIGSPVARAYLGAASVGTTMQNLNQSILARMPVGVPPLAEQKRIVAKVDELMALCDRLEAQQQERATRYASLARAAPARFAEAPTPANLQFLFHASYAIPPADLRKSILTLAVQGKLVPQDPNEEPAEEWDRTFAESNSDADSSLREPPFELPGSWLWLRVASIFEVASGIQKTPQRTPRNNAFPYMGVGNVYRGRLDLTSVKKFELQPGELERRRLEAGDLLIIEGNGSFNEIGRCAKWGGEIKDCVHQNHVIRCRPCDTSVSDFTLLFLNSPNGMEIMQRLAITSSGLYSLSVGKIRQIEIPIPPLAEQRRIVAKVEQLMALVDALETQLAASRATAANLLSALVAELTAPKTKQESKAKITYLHSTPEFIRATLAAEIVARSHDHDSFGQTKLQKIIYLAEYIFELPEIDSRPRRFARGPHDPEVIHQSEAKMAQCEWFKPVHRARGVGWKYVPLAQANGQRLSFEEQWPAKADAIRAFIDQLKTWPTERCERFATIYAAWNDLIIWKKPATDEAILSEVLDHWHPEKQNIPKSKWRETLQWIRQENYIPTGFGRVTSEEPSPTLFPL